MRDSTIYFLISQLWIMASYFVPEGNGRIGMLLMSVLFMIAFAIFAFMEFKLIRMQREIENLKFEITIKHLRALTAATVGSKIR